MIKPNYSLIRQHASDVYRYGRNDDKRIINALNKFYAEGKKSPSIASLIMKDEFKKSQQKYMKELDEDLLWGAPPFETISTFWYKHFKAIDSKDYIRIAQHTHGRKFLKSYEKMYPNTMKIREKLINTENVVMDYVTPKTNFFRKLTFKPLFREMFKKKITNKKTSD